MTDRFREVMGDRRIVLAPMAGGPSTPRLCTAVSEAGGLGFLAAGYLDLEALDRVLEEVEELASAPYGVNLFVPDAGPPEDAEVRYSAYRSRLIADEEYSPEVFPAEPRWSDDGFEEKLERVLRSSAACVSFTFGHPGEQAVRRVQEAGKAAILYATSRAGILSAARSGADAVGVQGIEAGGHRASAAGIDDDSAEDLPDLIAAARAATDRPVIAAGGVAGRDDVVRLMEAGADAVQVGTLFLTAREAGTKATHRRALLELKGRGTMLTRAFSGRPARTVENAFAAEHSAHAPALYPQVHYLTSQMRRLADAAGDPEHLNLWAGTGFAACREVEAAQLVRELTP